MPDVPPPPEHGGTNGVNGNAAVPAAATDGVSLPLDEPVPVIPGLTVMSRPLFEILQHQSRMQQQDLGISARLRDNSVAVGLRAMGVPLWDALNPLHQVVLRPCACNTARTHPVPFIALMAPPPAGITVAWKVVVAVLVMIDDVSTCGFRRLAC